MTLGEIEIGLSVTVSRVGGERAFRRRLMELGILPGTRIEVVRVAPLGDPIELVTRGCRLSIRKAEARSIDVTLAESPTLAREPASSVAEVPVGLPAAP